MNGGTRRYFQCSEPVKNALSFRDELSHLSVLGLAQQRFQVSPGNENRLFNRTENHALQRFLLFDQIQMFGEFVQRRLVENVSAGLGSIEDQQANVVLYFSLNKRGGDGRSHGEFSLAR